MFEPQVVLLPKSTALRAPYYGTCEEGALSSAICCRAGQDQRLASLASRGQQGEQQRKLP